MLDIYKHTISFCHPTYLIMSNFLTSFAEATHQVFLEMNFNIFLNITDDILLKNKTFQCIVHSYGT